MSSIDTLAVLTDPYLADYQVDTIERAVSKADIDVSLIVVNDADSFKYDPELEADAVNNRIGLHSLRLFVEVLQRERWWTFVIVEKKLREELGLLRKSSKIHVEEVDTFTDAEVIRTDVITDGAWSEFPDEIVDAVSAQSEVAIRYGYGLIKGDILDAPEQGVLSFHPADIRQYRGMGPPQAYLDGKRTMGVSLQRLNNDIDGGELIEYTETDVQKCNSLWEIYERLHDVEREMLAQGIMNLKDDAFTPSVPDTLGEYYSTKKRRKFTFATRVLLKNLF